MFEPAVSDGEDSRLTPPQTFRFLNAKSESLFLQRKNPRKIAWTQVYRRMHKKGITEEVAKKRSRKNIKVQVGIIGRGRRPEGWVRRRGLAVQEERDH